ncbi:putative peptidyl-tRNA hydrolase 2 [Tritrichomonas foetus]|uniref:peptidyl-tRNA hydrolase n=1 Tax=Tritrichomonas foetus TaxID=1144522 RepID=A0A1J4KFW4_9EUKA|nr:putative peptidyl-tRNA hydrolase 2 [Tritrichomonas foetus]|eukprot:OHT08237.1 putative peptidyl-tRNA hydrolase 2 [Tritrichomonas foetus]
MQKTAKILFFGAVGFAIGSVAYHYLSNRIKRKNNKNEYEYDEEEEEEEEEEDDSSYFDPSKIDLEARHFGVFIVRRDLKMGKGKICAQCGHAALGLFCKVLKHVPPVAEKWNDVFCKNFFYCADEAEMRKIEIMAQENNLLTEIIRDAGRTQIAANSATVLAIGPATIDQVNIVAEGLSPIK